MKQIKTGKHLACGCCGNGFTTWEGYVDQDQDRGYGICQDCQGFIEGKNQDEWDNAINVLRNGLNDKNKATFDNYDRDMQKAIVNKAMEDGALKWVINSRTAVNIMDM